MSDEASVAGENRQSNGRFVKGDPRIWRKGRPRKFDQWRNLTIEVLREPARDKNGEPIIIDGHIATNAEMIARSWLSDKKRQPDLIAAAFGKVPDRQENINIDVSQLSDEQLTRLAKGDDLRTILTTQSTSRDRAAQADDESEQDTD
jgi:hypothetical protein